MFDKEGQPLYTTAQAAEMLGVSPNTIKNASQRGGYRPGAGRRPTHEPAASGGEEGQGVE